MKHCKYFFIVYAIAILSSVGANAATVAGLATTDYVKGAINSLPAVARSGSYNDLTNKPTIPAAQVNSDWNATSGKAQILNKPTLGAMAAKNNVTNADIAANAAIATSKINGLDTALAGKQTTGNLVSTTTTVDGKVTIPDATSTTKYPSMAVAQQIAAEVVTKNMVNVNQKINALNTNYTNLSTTVENNKTAADNAIKALDSSVANANGAISTITITDGKITNVTRKSVDTADLAAGAVTPVKTSGVIGYIPSGSATATTYAQIWVQ